MAIHQESAAAFGSKSALSGYRILDFTAMMAGPYCTRWLSDLGAEVIKVEPPEGDYIRTRPPKRDGSSAHFAYLNAGKKSIVVNFKEPGAKEVIYDLARTADVVVEAFRPGVMKRLGFDYETLSKINPKIVFCSLSGYGQSGPAADRPAYGPIIHAASGFDMANWEYQGGEGAPPKCGIHIGDMLTGIFSAFAIQTALVQRERQGVGQHIDVALMDSMLSMLIFEILGAQFESEPRALYQPLRCTDGFVIVTPISQKNFENLCDATGNSSWRQDTKIADRRIRMDNWDYFMRLIETWTETHTAAECEEIFNGAAVPCSRYAKIEEVMAEPHYAHRGTFGSVSDKAGSFLVANLPFKLSQSKTEAGGIAPELGANSIAVLRDVLKYDEVKIAKLVESKAMVQG